MAEPHSYLEDPTALEPAAALRAELAQVRAEAEAERQRLEHELKLARSAQPSPRGGSFKAPAKSMHVFARRAFAPDTRIDTIGFRVARDAN